MRGKGETPRGGGSARVRGGARTSCAYGGRGTRSCRAERRRSGASVGAGAIRERGMGTGEDLVLGRGGARRRRKKAGGGGIAHLVS